MPFRPQSIRAKLQLLIAVSIGVALFLSAGLGGYRELLRFAEAKHAEFSATAEMMAAGVAEPMAAGDRGAVTRALNAIRRMPDVRFAQIADKEGHIVAEAGSGVALVSPQSGRIERPSLWSMLTGGSFMVAAEIVKGGFEVGRLALLVDTSELWQRAREVLLAAALTAAAAIAIALLVAARLQHSITRPLGELAATMDGVRRTSDFTQKAVRRSDDETGLLVDAFNDMLDQVRGRDDALEEHRVGLERTVALRTSELAAAVDVAESANRAKSDFLATMSHEIRTPLNGMLVMAELLAGGALPPPQRRYAEIVARSGQTLLRIINDILDLSKIEAGKLELEAGDVRPAQVVGEVLGLFFERAESKGLDLAAIIAPDVPEAIEGDPVRLSQVLSNLVNNALKFTERGHVLIEIRRRDDGAAEGLTFTVADTGIGIAADKVDKVFEAFSQADQSTTRRFGGTGLGLSISQKLAHAMGGRIWAESVLGEGSRFSFTIAARTREPAAALPRLPEEMVRALVAAEGSATRAALSAALAVEPAASGGRERFDWMIVDASRAAELARDRGLIGRRIVAITALGHAEDERIAEEAAVAATLMRPIVSTEAARLLADAAAGVKRTDAAPAAADSPHAALRGMHVLVADDSPVNQEVAREALKTLGVTCTIVDDGEQAVRAAGERRFDVVLMDCSMPVLDGFGATGQIREREQKDGTARVPIVALTADVAGASGDWREAGMDAYLSKPFTIRGLAECLTRFATGGGRPAAEATAGAGWGAAAISAAGPPLDGEVVESLRELAGGSEAILTKIMAAFREHAPPRLAGLEAALGRSDLLAAALEAHALKSPSRNVGALRLAELCAAIEQRARGGAAPEPGMVVDLREEFARVLAAVDDVIAGSLREAAA